MTFFKQKHVIVAVLVAPVLALGAYFAAGQLVGEKPQPAEPGQSYPLVEKPNCRYDSGRCGLVNADFELELTLEPANDGSALLSLSSAFPLEGVVLAVVAGESGETPPEPMNPVGADGLTWSLSLPEPVPERDRLRIVATAQGTHYYGDVSTEFSRR